MKVAVAHKFYFVKSGVGRYLFDMEALLASHGHATIPFAMRHEKNVPTPYEKYFVSRVGTERVRGGLEGLRTFGRMIYSREAKRQMLRLIDAERPDLCHVHNLYYQLSPSVLVALHERGVPTVMTVHDYHLVSPQYMMWSHGRVEDWSRAGILRAAASRFHKGSFAASFAAAFTFQLHRRMGLYKLVDRYLVSSQFMKGRLIQGGFDAAHIRVLPFGIPLPDAPSVPVDDGSVLFVGRLVEEKGIGVLLRAARALPHVSFRIAGEGPERERLRSLAVGLPNVEWLGFQSGNALASLYRLARCIVVPSLWQEVFGFVALEAMAAGKPVIASHVGGLPEVVRDRMTGLLVRPGSVPELVEAIERLTQDPDFAQTLGQAGRERAECEFNMERHYEGLMRVYAEAIEDHGRRIA